MDFFSQLELLNSIQLFKSCHVSHPLGQNPKGVTNPKLGLVGGGAIALGGSLMEFKRFRLTIKPING
jgi:hypothetical protein